MLHLLDPEAKPEASLRSRSTGNAAPPDAPAYRAALARCRGEGAGHRGRIGDDKAHLDFDIDMGKLVKDEIEERLNALTQAAHATRFTGSPTRSSMRAQSSCARCRWRRRVAKVGSGCSKSRAWTWACGGTHVKSTAEIGRPAVARIRSEGKRNKRVTLTFADGG